MPRTISTALQTLFQSAVVPITTLVKIDRADGEHMYFTTWDVAIVYDGNSYIPAGAMSPSAVKMNADLTTDQMDIMGAIDSDYIKEEDIDAGRYDLALITIMRINPFDTSMGVITDLVGYIEQIDSGDGQFTVGISSLGAKLSQQFGDIITPACRATFCDAQCKANISTYSHAGTVLSVIDSRTITFSNSNATGDFDKGILTWNSLVSNGGQNYNLKNDIKTSTQLGSNVMKLVFQDDLKYAVVAGNQFVAVEGCDKRPVTCRNRFHNLVNIHADPYTPGNDYLYTQGRPPS